MIFPLYRWSASAFPYYVQDADRSRIRTRHWFGENKSGIQCKIQYKAFRTHFWFNLLQGFFLWWVCILNVLMFYESDQNVQVLVEFCFALAYFRNSHFSALLISTLVVICPISSRNSSVTPLTLHWDGSLECNFIWKIHFNGGKLFLSFWRKRDT